MDRAELLKISVDEHTEIRGVKTHPVGQKKPNAWSLCDMHGNVGEWCRDWYQRELPGGTDPEVTKEANGRAIRGGGCYASTKALRSAHRRSCPPGGRSGFFGFRVTAVPTTEQAKKQ